MIDVFMKKESKIMMAKLWSQQVMAGKKTYIQVPRMLKEEVKAILIENKREDLIIEE